MVKRLKKIVFFWLPPVLWMALIFWLSSFHKLVASPISWQDFVIRKIAHFSEYFLLFLLFYRAFRNTFKINRWRMIIFSLVLTIMYAVSDELHQTFVSGRTGKLFDIGVDSTGSLLGAFLVAGLKPYLPVRIIKFLERFAII